MDVATLERWLRKRLLRDANLCLALSPLAVLGGLLVLFLTFWFSYAVIWMVAKVVLAIPALLFNASWKLEHEGRLWVTAGFMLLLVNSYLRSDRWRRQDYDEFAGDPTALGESLARFGTGAGRAGLLLLHPQASATMIVDLLFIGPQLLFGGIGLLQESGRARRADTVSASRVLWTLVAQPHKVGYEELAAVYTAAELKPAFGALRLLPGVVFLERGVTLTADLRSELTGVARGD